MVPRLNHVLLAATRLDLGLTQEQAAESLGIDVRTYRRYESGRVNHPTAGLSVRHKSRRRILDRIVQEFGITERDLWTPRTTTPAWVAAERGAWKILHAHTLPRARHYIGRTELVERLATWLRRAQPDAARVVALVGLGGSGKTSIVERMLSDLGEGPQEHGILVFSFYENARTEFFLDQALGYFNAAIGQGDGEDKLERLQRALADTPTRHLIVLDGLEVMQETGSGEGSYGRIADGSLRRLLTSAARGLGGTRFLVTSRFELSDLCGWEGSGFQSLKVGALTRAEAQSLLSRWGVTGPPEVIDRLIERVGQHALSVATLGSYAGSFLGGNVSVERARELEMLLQASALASAARDDAQARRLAAVLEAYARALAAPERDALSRLAVFPGGANVSQLEGMARAGSRLGGSLAGLERADIARILARLARLGLIHASDGDTYSAHPVVAEYFRSLLGVSEAPTREQAGAHVGGERAATSLDRGRPDLVSLHLPLLDLQQPGGAAQTLLAAYEPLILHALRSGNGDLAAQIYLRQLGGFRELGLRHGEMTRGERILRAFAPGADPDLAACELPPQDRARIIYDWGLYAGALGDLKLARRCYETQIGIACAIPSWEGVAMGLRTLAYTERLSGAPAAALALVDSSLQAAARAESVLDLGSALSLRAHILHDLGRTEDAANDFARARAYAGEPFARRSLWEAEHLLDLGEVARVVAQTECNLEGMTELGWKGHAAQAHILLGHAALRRTPADLRSARTHLSAALPWTVISTEVETLLRYLELDAQVALAELRFEIASEVIARGRGTAESCGFGLFVTRFAALAQSGIPVAAEASRALPRPGAAIQMDT